MYVTVKAKNVVFTMFYWQILEMQFLLVVSLVCIDNIILHFEIFFYDDFDLISDYQFFHAEYRIDPQFALSVRIFTNHKKQKYKNVF